MGPIPALFAPYGVESRREPVAVIRISRRDEGRVLVVHEDGRAHWTTLEWVVLGRHEGIQDAIAEARRVLRTDAPLGPRS